jgi:hypothetical protein
MIVTARKVLSATQRTLVEDACEQRGVEVEIIDQGPWILAKLRGEQAEVAAAWACIRAGRNECL